jgi:hypothetical protein
LTFAQSYENYTFTPTRNKDEGTISTSKLSERSNVRSCLRLQSKALKSKTVSRKFSLLTHARLRPYPTTSHKTSKSLRYHFCRAYYINAPVRRKLRTYWLRFRWCRCCRCGGYGFHSCENESKDPIIGVYLLYG